MINDELSLDHPPCGIRMEQTVDGGTAITVRMFGMMAFVMLLLALGWNGIISMPIRQAVTIVARRFGWSLPDWFKSASDSSGNTLTGLFIGLFLIPFIAAGIWMIWTTLFYFFGQFVIRLSYNEGSIFTGIGFLGRSQNFSLKSVRSIDISRADIEEYASRRIVIEMHNGREIKFPLYLGKIHSTWLLFALHKILGRPLPEEII